MPGTASPPSPAPLEKRLATYGCSEIVRLDERLTDPAQLEYLDLLPRQANQPSTLSAVVEHQGTALLYVVDATHADHSSSTSFAPLQRLLANRSDPAWLGVIRHGSLDILPIGFHEASNSSPVTVIEERGANAPLFFQSLIHGTFDAKKKLRGTDYVYNKIFELLTRTTDAFVPEGGKGKVDPLAVLSMAGRALFFRFLIDRKIVRSDELTDICPSAAELKDAFSTPEKAAHTSAWLDFTFNGDFLALVDESIPTTNREARLVAYRRFYQRVKNQAGSLLFTHLRAILHGWKVVGEAIQTELDWGDFDFAHIPVGVLSQVYESFSHRADPQRAKETSVHYTPRTIAGLMVDEAFAALPDKAGAKVLDPSCGAGIFLVLAFRRMVRERWKKDDARPKTGVIQEILYGQLRGFDVSEPALRMAALALYITAIELNASPRPPVALKFPRNLRGEVLHQFAAEAADEVASSFVLGSLGPGVPDTFNGLFDLVIGNPPWTRLRGADDDTDEEAPSKSPGQTLNEVFTKIGRRVLSSRGLEDLAAQFSNPDNNPDLPFLWRATEWCNTGGIIAMALHPRLFIRSERIGVHAWRCVMSVMQVTGVLNGAHLRKTAVWDGMDAAFSLFFARNVVPSKDYLFQFAAPSIEPTPNKRGRFRIDYESAHSVDTATSKRLPWLLKALTFGTGLDVDIMQSLTNGDYESLDEWWTRWDSKRLQTGEGFSRVESLQQRWVTFLAGLPVFEEPEVGYDIDYRKLSTFAVKFGANRKGEVNASAPRRPELYRPPLVIVRRAQGADPYLPKAYIARRPTAFSKSYYGYSFAGHPEAETAAALVFLLAHSTLFRYFSLMVSVSQGIDYMMITKRDFDLMPFPDIVELAPSMRAKIRLVADRLESGTLKSWLTLDNLVYSLYGLDVDAAQVARDTLFASTPYRHFGKPALASVSKDERQPFITALRRDLEPYFEICGESLHITEASVSGDGASIEPWVFLAVSHVDMNPRINPSLLRKACEIANQKGVSRILLHAGKNRGVLLGLLNQARWWTATRGRLCAQAVIRDHLSAFGFEDL